MSRRMLFRFGFTPMPHPPQRLALWRVESVCQSPTPTDLSRHLLEGRGMPGGDINFLPLQKVPQLG
jgi:hypothetical protein